MKDRIARRQAYFVSLKKPFRVLEPVEAWKKEHSEALKERKKTLVLEGGTCLGKTQYIRNLFGADCCFEVHASSPTSWSLRDFVSLQHKCILWDEATQQVMIQNKVLYVSVSECSFDARELPDGELHLRCVGKRLCYGNQQQLLDGAS